MNPSPPSPFEATLLEVFREQSRRIWSYFMRGSADPASAEDLLQESFLRVWDGRESMSGDIDPSDREGLRRYLWRVVRNLMIDEIRFRQRQRRNIPDRPPGEPELQAPDPGPDPEETLLWDQGLAVLRQTLETIKNENGRRCLGLWLEGVQLADISEAVGMAPGRVRGLIQRTRAELLLRASTRFRAGRA